MILSQLFPTKLSAVIFGAYTLLFVNQAILVTSSKDENNKYQYNTTAVVLFTECLKLVISITLFIIKEKSFWAMFYGVTRNWRVLLLYFVPAGLYCLYNNLQFVNLAAYDPTTYYILLQFKVVFTGIVFQVLFKKVLSLKQWISLCLLTFGCIVKQINFQTLSDIFTHNDVTFGFGKMSLVLLQTLCSCLAGVYNEYLLKGKHGSVNIWVQNMFMYFDSIVCNILILIFSGNISSAFTKESMQFILDAKVLCIILNYAIGGIVTSLVLRNLNSIVKTFSGALELILTAILCWIIFGIPIDMFASLAIVIVSYASYIYATSPVVNSVITPVDQNNIEHTVSDVEKGSGIKLCNGVRH